MTWNRWRWLEGGLLPLLVVLMRVCWIWPWLQLAHRLLTPTYPDDFLSVWMVIALFLGGVFTARVSLQRAPSISRARLWAATAGMAAILGVLWWQYARTLYALWDPRWIVSLGQALAYWEGEVSPPFVTLLVAAGIWLRGVLDGRERITNEQVWDVFKFGFVALALFLLADALVAAGRPAGMGRWIILFFAAGMAALALSSLELSWFGRRSDSESQLRHNRYWLTSVLTVVIVVLALGLLIGALISPDVLARGIGWIGNLLAYVGVAVGYVLLLAAYVLFLLLLPLFNWLQTRFGGMAPLEARPFQNMLERPEELQAPPGVEIPAAVIESSRWLGLAGVFVLVAVAFAVALRYFRNPESESSAETRETILSRDLLQDQLASLWRNWQGRFRLWPGAAQSPYLSLEGLESGRSAIRALYQQFLSVTKQLGVPRAKIETPAEFQHTLEASLPADHVAMESMTVEYTRARYGPDAPSSAAVETARSAWEALRPTLTQPQSSQEEEREPPGK